MYSPEIYECLSNLNVSFYGVYPSDQLPRTVQYPAALVVNTDPHTKPGSHWTAIFINENRELNYFDSYGRPPKSLHMTRFIQRNSRKAKFSKTVLQDVKSTVCGQYCIVFLLFLSRGISMEEFLNIFSNSPIDNDFCIEVLFHNYFRKMNCVYHNQSYQSCCCMRRAITQ